MLNTVRLVYAMVFATALGIGFYAYHTYYGRYFFVVATRGLHSEGDYEKRLQNSLEHDPSYGYAHFAMARLMMRHGYYGAALPHQKSGMQTFNSIRGYQQMGTIMDRLDRRDDAREQFEKALRMYPNDLDSLERLGKLSFEDGDEDTMIHATDQILRLDMGNVNAHFLRARAAEQQGNLNLAYTNYQRISTILSRSSSSLKGAFFDPEEIAKRMVSLRKAILSP